MSSFAVTGRAKEKPDLGPDGGVDDARMEAAMAEMEREMSGFDEENPNPRHLAQMMRKMSQISGEKMPAPMEEMLRRLEAGEDPERLEEEMGDTLDDDDSADGSGDETPAQAAMRARLKTMRGKPGRDPTLYEMSDFVK